VTRNTFLWLGTLLGLFVGPRVRRCRTSTPTHTVRSLTAEIIHSELGPVRSPQPQPRLASRARRRSPDSATFQRETRAHQRTTFPHSPSRFRTRRRPTRPKPNRAVSSAAPEHHSLESHSGWHPEGACRTGRDTGSWLCVLRRRGPLGHISNTPLSLTHRWSSLKRTGADGWPTEASTLTARANGFGGPESRGAFESPESQGRGATPSGRDAPIPKNGWPREVGSLGSPSRLFHQTPRWTFDGSTRDEWR